jgi:hypothetical protein
MTRDREPDTGELAGVSRIWLARPSRTDVASGAIWMAPAMLEDLYGEWSLDDCLRHARTYPDDDRQCIRVVGDRVKLPADRVDRSTVR